MRDNLGKNITFARSQTIARTEIMSASNSGTIAGAEVSGYRYNKVWISTFDARTRSISKGDEFDHLAMDGSTVNQDAKFNVQGDQISFPCDPRGQPGNVINCRCAVATINL
jgi:uncharacterized protein with gpF-like domain